MQTYEKPARSDDYEDPVVEKRGEDSEDEDLNYHRLNPPAYLTNKDGDRQEILVAKRNAREVYLAKKKLELDLVALRKEEKAMKEKFFKERKVTAKELVDIIDNEFLKYDLRPKYQN